MPMNLGSAGLEDDPVIAVINTTPLVDVMLVLLIVFLITVPVATQTRPVRLPDERAEVLDARVAHIAIAVDRSGTVYWQDRALAGRAELVSLLQAAAAASPQPQIQLRGDLDAAYAGVGRVLNACRRAGLARVTLVTQPASRAVERSRG